MSKNKVIYEYDKKEYVLTGRWFIKGRELYVEVKTGWFTKSWMNSSNIILEVNECSYD